MVREYKPGDVVVLSGMYRIQHQPAHTAAEGVYLALNDTFPGCDQCEEPLYTLILPADISVVSKARQFFADLELAFHQQFGREMTYEERWFLELAERAVTAAEHQNGQSRPVMERVASVS